jgi:hypothetical protein
VNVEGLSDERLLGRSSCRVPERLAARALSARDGGRQQIETEAAPIRYVAELIGADTDNERPSGS